MPSPTSEFSFLYAKGGYTYGNRVKVIEDTPIFKSGVGDSPGFNGTAQGVTLLKERRLDLSGTIIADSQSALRNARDEFMAYHQHGAVDKIIVSGNRWLWGAIDGPISYKIHTQRLWQWEAQMICGDPFYYENGLKTRTLSSTSGGTVSTTIDDTHGLLGNAYATPWLEFNVNSISTIGASSISVINDSTYLDGYTYRQQSFVFLPRDTGLHKVYFGPNCTDDAVINRTCRHRVSHATEGTSVTKYRRDTGEIILLPGASNVLTVTLTGVTLTANPVLKWYNRFV